MTAEENDDNIIVAKGITKRFNGKPAVDNIDLEIRRGEMFGLLGPNGAGKTTTVRIISSLTMMDSGTVTIDGMDLIKQSNEAKGRLGVIQQHISLDKDLTVRENLIHHAMLHMISRSRRNARIQELVDYVSLGDYLDRTVDSLSGGWKKRVAIIAALIHEPKILFLDEPTTGLDIQARRGLWDLVRKLNNDGTTIILTTHYIEEAENLCDRVGIIDKGRIIALDTPRNLCETVGKIAVECKHRDGHTDYNYFKDREEANIFSSSAPDDVEVVIRRTNLEDCFVRLTGSSVGDQ